MVVVLRRREKGKLVVVVMVLRWEKKGVVLVTLRKVWGRLVLNVVQEHSLI